MQATDLLKLAEMLSSHRNLSPSTVSMYATNDGKFFQRIVAGGGCTLKTASRVVRYFDAAWPADLAWPTDIPRPRNRRKLRNARRSL